MPWFHISHFILSATAVLSGCLAAGTRPNSASAGLLTAQADANTANAVAATDGKIVVYGRWAAVGTTYQTVTNGAEATFKFAASATATLTFEVTGAESRPMIIYWLDDGPATRVRLDKSGKVVLTPAAGESHTVRFISNVDSEYPSYHDDWTSRRDALKFVGVALEPGGVFLDSEANANRIEFLGDSITASLRNRYAGTDSIDISAPELGFPERVCKALGYACVVNGHGGQGLNNPSSDGAPRAVDAFDLVYAGTAWNPDVKPKIVVIYHGTNGAFTTADYLAYLRKIRAAYPDAHIVSISPHLAEASKWRTMQAAVVQMADPSHKVYFFDYGNVLNAGTNTTDGLHPNESGDELIAAQMLRDIRQWISP